MGYNMGGRTGRRKIEGTRNGSIRGSKKNKKGAKGANGERRLEKTKWR